MQVGWRQWEHRSYPYFKIKRERWGDIGRPSFLFFSKKVSLAAEPLVLLHAHRDIRHKNHSTTGQWSCWHYYWFHRTSDRPQGPGYNRNTHHCNCWLTRGSIWAHLRAVYLTFLQSAAEQPFLKGWVTWYVRGSRDESLSLLLLVGVVKWQ